MSAIRRIGLAVAVATLSLAVSGWAGEHVVTQEVAQAALAGSAAQRAADLQTLEAALSSPAAERVAARGLDVAGARRALKGLSAEELGELAARAGELNHDPVAGLSKDAEDLLVIFLIVALVILVLQAVD
jgi:hypothetical protein